MKRLALILVLALAGCATQTGQKPASVATAMSSILPPQSAMAFAAIRHSTNPPAPPVTSFTLTASGPTRIFCATNILGPWNLLGDIGQTNAIVVSNTFGDSLFFRGQAIVTVTWINESTNPVEVCSGQQSSVYTRYTMTQVFTNAFDIIVDAGTNYIAARAYDPTSFQRGTFSNQITYKQGPFWLTLTPNRL